MLMEKFFEAKTPIFGVAGSSYGLQLGKFGNKWTLQIIRGDDVLACETYKEELPVSLLMIHFVISNTLPGLNPRSIMKTIQALKDSIKRWH